MFTNIQHVALIHYQRLIACLKCCPDFIGVKNSFDRFPLKTYIDVYNLGFSED